MVRGGSITSLAGGEGKERKAEGARGGSKAEGRGEVKAGVASRRDALSKAGA